MTCNHESRTRYIRQAACIIVVLLTASSCEESSEPPIKNDTASKEQPAQPTPPTKPQWQQAVTDASDWLDTIDFELVELRRARLDSIKKLAEMLDAYHAIATLSNDESLITNARTRAAHFAAKTDAPKYHSLRTWSDKEFNANSMSYLRVAWIIDDLELDADDNHEKIADILPRLNESMIERGGWQRTMFKRYYQHLQWQWPGDISASPTDNRLVTEDVPFENYTPQDAYEFTHIVFAAWDYGQRRQPTGVNDDQLHYLRSIAPQLTAYCMQIGFPDLVAESLSCMIYLGQRDHPTATQAADWLMQQQHANGAWGDYESLRSKYNQNLDIQLTLHTVRVCLRALLEYHNW